VEADCTVFPDAVVEGGGPPGVGKEDHGDGLAEVVELETCGANGGEDGGVGDCGEGDLERAGAEDEVGVGCCAKWISYDEKCDVDVLGIS